MRLFNRGFASYIRNLPRVPHYLWYFTKCLFLFKRPFRFLHAYLTVRRIGFLCGFEFGDGCYD